MIITCQGCELEFKQRNHGQKFHSRECWQSWRTGRLTIGPLGQCTTEGCQKPVKSRGLCPACYERGRRAGTVFKCERCQIEIPRKYRYCATCAEMVKQEQRIRYAEERNERHTERKKALKCPACGVADARWSNGPRPRRRWCVSCLARGRKDTRLRILYGIGLVEYERLLAKQNNRCAICRTSRPGGAGEYWPVDHDHITGQVRGLLCHRCNTALGQFQDDPEVIARALSYVAQHRQTVLRLATA